MRRRVVKIRSISRLIPRLLHRNVNPQESQPEISSTRGKKKKKKKAAAAAADELQFSVQYLQSCDFPPLGNLHARTHARAQTWTPIRGTAPRLPGRGTGTGGPLDAPGTGAGILF